MKLYIFFLLSFTVCISHGTEIVCVSCTLSDLVCNNHKHPEIAIHNATCESNDVSNKPACYKIQAKIGGVAGRIERGCVENETTDTCQQLENNLKLNSVAVNETFSNFECFLCNTGDKCNSTTTICSNTALLLAVLLLVKSVKSIMVY